MDIVPTRMTVADYCQAMERHEIGVNRDYQRSDRVWPPAAKSFLIETILLAFPMPKLSLHQVTDLRSRRATKQIVDGQQRSVAIFEFFSNELRLSRTLALEEAAGKLYDQLPADLQARFMNYGLSIDLFVSATDDEVRESFRRVNSYTIPLNPEEQRHASFQGPFKWFIHRLTRDFDEAFLRMGVLGSKQVVRMADAKLWTEICHALVHGITTTKKPNLDGLYRSRDVDFPDEAVLDARLRRALDFIVGIPEIHETELMKPYQFYALVLAVSHFLEPVATLSEAVPVHGRTDLDRDVAVSNLSALADAVENQAVGEPFADFVAASVSRTNVASQRLTRVRYAYEALVGNFPM